MSLQASWPGREGKDYLVAETGTPVTFELSDVPEALQAAAVIPGSEPIRVLIRWKAGARELRVDELLWKESGGSLLPLTYRIPVTRVARCEAVLAAPYADVVGAAAFTFVPRPRALFAKALLLGTLGGLAFFFAPILVVLAGALKRDLLLAWGTPAVAALVALLSTEVLQTRRPPLFGVLHFPARAMLAVLPLVFVPTLFAWGFATAITNATPSPLALKDGEEALSIDAGATVVVVTTKPRLPEFWTNRNGPTVENPWTDNHCVHSPEWKTPNCMPFPAGITWPTHFRVVPRVVVQCRGERWVGWAPGAGRFKGAREAEGSVWLEPGEDCVPKKDAAMVTVVRALGADSTEEITARYPWKRPSDSGSTGQSSAPSAENEAKRATTSASSRKPLAAPGRLVFEERRPSENVITRRFVNPGSVLCVENSGGLYSVLLGGTAEGGLGHELGTLRCAPEAPCIHTISLSTSALSELTLEASGSRVWWSTWSVSPERRGTQIQAFACRPPALPSARAAVVFASRQEPEDIALSISGAIELEVRSTLNGDMLTVGHGNCSGTPELPAWHRWSLRGANRAMLVARDAEVSGQHHESSWHREETLTPRSGAGFPSAWLCGATASSAKVNGSLVASGAREFQLAAHKVRYLVLARRGRGKLCPPNIAPTNCEVFSGEQPSDFGYSNENFDAVKECDCEAR